MTNERERPLTGGIAFGRVVQVGDTVRREAGPWTPTVFALLSHLRVKGFPAPTPLGIDEAGREILSFLPGRAANWPFPPALIATSGARQVGALLARYHAAVADFTPPSPAVWRHGPQSLGRGEIALHGDFGPHNLIWWGEDLTGVIDFELARPGRPLEDAGFAVIRAVQLRPDDMARKAGFDRTPDRRARLAAFAEGYGGAPDDFITAARASQVAEIDRVERLGGAGLEPWAGFLRIGLADQARAELAWIEEFAGALV
jgi:Ser/Thr protein kinase RdoA (MazF antagonist)